MGDIIIPEEFFNGLLWNNDKPYSEAQAYIQFMRWANEMGGQTMFINSTMITLKQNEFVMAQRKIADSLNWTQSAVGRFIKKLVNLNQVRLNNDSKLTRILLVVNTPVTDSKLTQVPTQPTTLYDSAFGGGVTNSDIIDNNNIIYNNNTNDNTNTTTNNNIYSKSSKNLDTGNSDIRVSRVSKSVTPKYTNKPKDLDMVKDYFSKKHPDYVDQAVPFFEWFESVGWKRGKTPIKKWRMAVGQWVRTEQQKQQRSPKARTDQEIDTTFKKSPGGDFMGYCTNNNCSTYGSTLFFKNTWELKGSCKKCGFDITPTRPSNPPQKQKRVTHEEEFITLSEFQAREEKSPEGSGITKGGSQLLSEVFGSMFQPGQGRSKP